MIRSIDNEELRNRLIWLIRLRWIGIVGVLVATHVLREIAFMSFSLIPVYSILGCALAYNFFFNWRLRFPRENFHRLAIAQILLDQIMLAFAMYFSGGCDSPFIYFFVFHVVISGIILPRRESFIFTGLAALFPSTIMGLKHFGILPHLGIFRNEPMIFTDMSVVASYGLVFITTLFLTAYFVTYLSSKLHDKNEEVVRLYALSERLRSSIRLKEVIRIIETEVCGFMGATKSVYLPLDKTMRRLTMNVSGNELNIPLIEKNTFTEVIMKGTASFIDAGIVTSAYESRALEIMQAKRCVVLPVMAASLRTCYEHFNCSDTKCLAYGQETEKCWQISGTHCKGTIVGNYREKLELCLACELFTPVGLYLLNVPTEYVPLVNADMEACMRLLEASGLAVSNALLYEKTMELSKTDGLTGLKNHKEFKEALNAEVLRSKRYHRPFSLLMVDVDYFKNYNDANGHPQGDVLLKKLSELISDNFKDTDIVARYGGEEFVVMLLETGTKEQAAVVAERLRSMVEWCAFPKEEMQPGGKVTVSIGVSCCPEDGETAEDILKAADDALYRAKREGKNRVAFRAPRERIVDSKS